MEVEVFEAPHRAIKRWTRQYLNITLRRVEGVKQHKKMRVHPHILQWLIKTNLLTTMNQVRLCYNVRYPQQWALEQKYLSNRRNSMAALEASLKKILTLMAGAGPKKSIKSSLRVSKFSARTGSKFRILSVHVLVLKQDPTLRNFLENSREKRNLKSYWSSIVSLSKRRSATREVRMGKISNQSFLKTKLIAMTYMALKMMSLRALRTLPSSCRTSSATKGYLIQEYGPSQKEKERRLPRLRSFSRITEPKWLQTLQLNR